MNKNALKKIKEQEEGRKEERDYALYEGRP